LSSIVISFVLISIIHLHPSLLLASKAGETPRGAFRDAPLWRGVSDKDKRSSLLRCRINYGCKKFYSTVSNL